MRLLALVMVGLLACGTASAQTPKEDRHRKGTYKMLVGTVAIAGGVVALLNSRVSESVTVPASPGFRAETLSASETIWTNVFVGTLFVGGGTYFVVDGRRDRRAAAQMPSTNFSLAVGKQRLAFGVRRRW